MNIILGSASPRRKELFARMGLDFTIKAPKVLEIPYPDKSRLKIIKIFMRKNVLHKYKAINADAEKTSLIFCFDTVVYYKKKVYEKPSSKDDAFKMLQELSGKKHLVLTAALASYNNKSIIKIYKSKVWFKPLPSDTINQYLNIEKYEDAAGAYKIQENGLMLIKKICGSYFNIVGLPIEFVTAMIDKFSNEKF